MTFSRRVLLYALLAAASFTATFVPGAENHLEFFEKKIRPIFTEHCYSCHSAQAEKIKGGLLLDSKEGLLKGGESGPAIVPGDPENSLLIKAVRYADKDLQMPPKDKKLLESQINDLLEWVKMGAPDPRVGQSAKPGAAAPVFDFVSARTNWAFHLADRVAVPPVKDKSWVKNPIDSFILAKLEEKNLKPASPAEKRTLIRRATFDLIGLPPTEQEIEAFFADKSPTAFAKVVDRLLASPHYGERWARHWLDVVRYTDSLDSRGVGGDQDVAEAWRYRDWVVNAFNNDLPYDQFIKEQVAGDLLPIPAGLEIDTNAIIATGMYAIGNWGNGDADKEKILTDIADDAVDVTGRAFLGLTLACARCHDHKFDPISTADYYGLAGIFFSSHIIPKLAPKGSGESLLRIPLVSNAELERRKERETHLAKLEQEIEKIQGEQILILASNTTAKAAEYLRAAAVSRTNASLDGPVVANQNLSPLVLRRWIDFFESATQGLLTTPVTNLLGMAGLHALRNSDNADTPSVVANSCDLEASFLTIKLPAHRLAVHPSPKNGVTAAWKSPITGSVQVRGRVVDVDPNCGDGIDWQLVKLSGGVTAAITNGSIPSGGEQPFTVTNSISITRGEYIELVVLPKGGYECDTTMVEFEVKEVGGKNRVWDIDRDVAGDLIASNPHSDSLGNTDVWYFRDLAKTNLTAPEGSAFSDWSKLWTRNELNGTNVAETADRVANELKLRAGEPFYKNTFGERGTFWAPLRNELGIYSPERADRLKHARAGLAELRNRVPPPISMAHGLQEGGVPESPHAGTHDVKIHVRGRYDRLGEIVPRRFPQLLAGEQQPAITNGSGRLQLAEWLASPTNPLTARVMVNRIWQHHLGEGIVRTPNNFGKLGTPPTHPELLDYLALEFVKSGWSIKSMHRAIMLSATYQQSSVPRAETLQSDPENKLFGRMNRRRLDAEALRDSLLSVTRGLDESFGGPAIRDLNNSRRTIYLMTIRSDRSNYRALFDAADPNSIVEQRVVSTVAPQALFLLNHPFALEQTKQIAALAENASSDDRKRIQWLYQTLYGRPPTSAETKLGVAALDAARGRGDEAVAWEQYCQALLCANEFVYVD